MVFIPTEQLIEFFPRVLSDDRTTLIEFRNGLAALIKGEENSEVKVSEEDKSAEGARPASEVPAGNEGKADESSTTDGSPPPAEPTPQNEETAEIKAAGSDGLTEGIKKILRTIEALFEGNINERVKE